jgi:hypothetical protein
MYLQFQGTLAGHGQDIEIEVEMEAIQEGIRVLKHLGRFLWHGPHRFAVGQQYHLKLKDGRFYEVQIMEIKSDLVKFETF